MGMSEIIAEGARPTHTSISSIISRIHIPGSRYLTPLTSALCYYYTLAGHGSLEKSRVHLCLSSYNASRDERKNEHAHTQIFLPHTAEDANNGDKGRGGGAAVLIQLLTNAETK